MPVQVQEQAGGGPVHVKLVLEWDMPAKTQVQCCQTQPGRNLGQLDKIEGEKTLELSGWTNS
jgi:hypothetical protein